MGNLNILFEHGDMVLWITYFNQMSKQINPCECKINNNI